MSEIPEDVLLAAIAALGGHGELRIIEVIARAILVENERCAKIAESFLRGGINYDYESGSANGISAAIRRR